MLIIIDKILYNISNNINEIFVIFSFNTSKTKIFYYNLYVLFYKFIHLPKILMYYLFCSFSLLIFFDKISYKVNYLITINTWIWLLFVFNFTIHKHLFKIFNWIFFKKFYISNEWKRYRILQIIQIVQIRLNQKMYTSFFIHWLFYFYFYSYLLSLVYF